MFFVNESQQMSRTSHKLDKVDSRGGCGLEDQNSEEISCSLVAKCSTMFTGCLPKLEMMLTTAMKVDQKQKQWNQNNGLKGWTIKLCRVRWGFSLGSWLRETPFTLPKIIQSIAIIKILIVLLLLSTGVYEHACVYKLLVVCICTYKAVSSFLCRRASVLGEFAVLSTFISPSVKCSTAVK